MTSGSGFRRLTLPKHFTMRQRTNIMSYPLAGFVRLLAHLPLWALYLLADLLYFIMGHVVAYRKKVIMGNLRKSFPEKSEQELNRIRKGFYRHLADVAAETVKLLTIKDSEVIRRCEFDPEGKALMLEYFENDRSFIGLLGHFGNWEWVPPMVTLNLPFPVIPVYRPMRDKVIDRLLLSIRGRYTYELVNKNTVGRQMIRYNRMDKPYILGLIADQTPPVSGSYSTTFLSQETLVFGGPEKLARSFKMPVFFVALRKKKRGHYYLHTELLSEKPSELAEGELSQLFMSRLEREIRAMPSFWLWSHRRWKRSK